MAVGYRIKRFYTKPFRYVYDRAVEPISYGYPLGRIRVLEGRLLPLQRLERLVEARDFAEQRRILAETGYGELFSEAQSAEDVEAALDIALERAYDFMEESRLPEPIIEFFRVRYDFLNLRMLLKARLAGAPKPSRWSVHGSIASEVFEEAAEAEGTWMDILPQRLSDLAAMVAGRVRTGAEGEEETAQGAEAALIDMAIDKALYQRIRDITAREGSAWFLSLGRTMVDLANARIALRARRFGKDDHWLAGALIDGGNVPARTIREATSAPLGEIMEKVRAVVRGLPRDIETALGGKLLAAETMDVAADNVVIHIARTGKGISMGVEPIVSYMLAVENEIQLLRIVLLGKLANLPVEAIHERVRELYV